MGEERDPQGLLEHAGWVRALARTLATSGPDADDLAQDALVVALGRRGAARELRAWLGGVVRNLARRRRRGAERMARRERERAEGAPRSAAAADELVEQAELQRELIGLVTGLEEPYRSTVLLRFFEGLELVEIARRQGLPASTARTRLSRALERLRERLDERHGARDAWLPLVAALPEQAGGGALAAPLALAEGLTMGTKLKLAASAGVLAALVAVWNAFSTAPTSSDVGVVAPQPELRRPAQGTTFDAPAALPAGGAGREVVASAATSSGGAAVDPLGVLVYGSVTGPGGARVPQGRLSFLDASAEGPGADLGAPGSYSVVGLAPGSWRVLARCPGFYPAERELAIPPGEPLVRFDLVLEPSITLRIRFQDALGQPLPPQHDRDLYPVAVATLEAPGATLPGIEGRDAARYGVGEYRHRDSIETLPGVPSEITGLLELQAPPPLYVSAVVRDAVLATVAYAGPTSGTQDELVFTLDPETLLGQLGSLRVTVVDALSGLTPGEGALTLGHPPDFGLRRALGANGAVFFERVQPDLLELGFQVPGYERFSRTVRVQPGQTSELGVVALALAATIRGVVLDPEGRPANAMVTWLPLDRIAAGEDVHPNDYVQSGPDGRFEIVGAGRGQLALVAYCEEYARAPVFVDARGGLVEGVEMRLVAGPRVTFATPNDEALEGCLVTLADGAGRPFYAWHTRPGMKTYFPLPPGPARLRITHANEVLPDVHFTVGSEPLLVELPGLEGAR